LALRPEQPESKDQTPADKKKASQDEVFLREVDDALREDEMKSFFTRFGAPLLAAIVIGLAGLGGYLWWDNSQKQAADARGEKLIVALDELQSQNLEGADKQLDLVIEEGGTASAASAKLLRAGIALQQDRQKDALKLYAEVAADADAPQPFRDLATIREVAASFDDMEPQAVVDTLKPLAVPGSPWFGVAGELVGMAYLKQDKEDLAGPLFAKIARDEDVPQSLRGRARQLAGLLGVDAIEDVIGDADAADVSDGKTADDESAASEESAAAPDSE